MECVIEQFGKKGIATESRLEKFRFKTFKARENEVFVSYLPSVSCALPGRLIHASKILDKTSPKIVARLHLHS